jgi:hypothetical protein
LSRLVLFWRKPRRPRRHRRTIDLTSLQQFGAHAFRLASGLSILLIATIIGTFAALAVDRPMSMV